MSRVQHPRKEAMTSPTQKTFTGDGSFENVDDGGEWLLHAFLGWKRFPSHAFSKARKALSRFGSTNKRLGTLCHFGPLTRSWAKQLRQILLQAITAAVIGSKIKMATFRSGTGRTAIAPHIFESLICGVQQLEENPKCEELGCWLGLQVKLSKNSK